MQFFRSSLCSWSLYPPRVRKKLSVVNSSERRILLGRTLPKGTLAIITLPYKINENDDILEFRGILTGGQRMLDTRLCFGCRRTGCFTKSHSLAKIIQHQNDATLKMHLPPIPSVRITPVPPALHTQLVQDATVNDAAIPYEITVHTKHTLCINDMRGKIPKFLCYCCSLCHFITSTNTNMKAHSMSKHCDTDREISPSEHPFAKKDSLNIYTRTIADSVIQYEAQFVLDGNATVRKLRFGCKNAGCHTQFNTKHEALNHLRTCKFTDKMTSHT